MTVTYDGFNKRFPKTDLTSADVNSIWLFDAKEWLESSLAERFTLPFCSNNITADRLIYQKAWHLKRLGTIDPADSEEMGNDLQAEIMALLEGNKAMIIQTDSGNLPIYAEKQQSEPQEEIWSDTKDYHRVFDLDDADRERVDRDRIINVRNKRH